MVNRTFVGIGLAASLFAASAYAQHQIALKNGQQVVGEIQGQTLKLKTSMGSMDLPLADITAIQGGNIQLSDGTLLKGTFIDKSIAIQTRFGLLNIKTQDVKEIAFAAPQAAPQQAAPQRAAPQQAAQQQFATAQQTGNGRTPISGPSEKEVGAQRTQGGFMSPTRVTSNIGQTVEQAQVEAADGPKKRVAIRKFENKTAVASYGQYNIGTGMLDMLTTALVNTGRFVVLEREQMDDVMVEQNFGASGRVKGRTAAKIGEVEGAELLIYAAVTDYMADQSGTQASVGQSSGAGIGALFGPVGIVVGAIAGGLAASASAQKAHVSIDLRLVDAQTGRVVSATSVEGSPKNIGAEISFGAFGGSGFTKTPIGMAIRDCINNAVNWMLITSFPQEKEKFLAVAAAAEAAAKAEAAKGSGQPQSAGNGSQTGNQEGAKPTEGGGNFFTRMFSGDRK